jgi:hypothetical protein
VTGLARNLLLRFWAKLARPTKRSISRAACVFISIAGITISVAGLANAQGQPSPSVAEEEKLEQCRSS